MADSIIKPQPPITWTRNLQTKVRSLYVLHGLSPKEISDKLGCVDARQVRNLIHRRGWAKAKAKAQAELAQRETAELAKAGDEIAEFVESVAIQSEELVEKGFNMARGAIDAKEFAFAAQGTKTFVQLARQAQGLDAKASKATSRQQTVAVVFGRFPGQGEPIQSAPIDVQARDVPADDAPEIELDFDQSQQGPGERAASADLIADDA